MTAKQTSITSRRLKVQFIGSFVKTEQLPQDKRPHVAVAGRSNVGKSSLLNAYFGQKNIAKVSATPGKTRALNFFLVNDKFYMVDLPGYGYAKVAKSLKQTWSGLIEDYLRKEKRLIGLLLLIDSRREVSPDDDQLIDWLSARKTPVLTILTKADKLGRGALMSKQAAIEKALNAEAMPFSAVTGMGKNELSASVRQLVREYTEERD